jgi:predicted DNA-binding protein (MmcQ/YjbR family)
LLPSDCFIWLFMDIETFREHCLAVKGAIECFPFDETVLVFKVAGKMFAYGSLSPGDGRLVFNLKCDPERSVALRERYRDVGPGHHTSSIRWNGVALEGDVPDRAIVELIGHSVDEVLLALPKAKREAWLRGE